MATISKGIKLYKDGTPLDNLQEIPELGGTREAIEITTLDDDAHMYEDGILNYGDSLPFKFLYDDGEQFSELVKDGASHKWIVVLPDKTSCSFDGKASAKLDGVGVNAALTFTLSIKPSSELVWGTYTATPQA